MKDKICIFNAESDATAIELNVCDADVTINRATDSTLGVTLPVAKNVNAGSDKGTLYVSQTKRPPLFSRRQKIEISVPEHIVPALRLNARHCNISVEGGIYGEVNMICESGTIRIENTDAESVEINGGRLEIDVESSTLKGSLYINARTAEFLAQNTFAGLAVVRTRKGNMGIVALNTKECTLETDDGNITATLKGKREDFCLKTTEKAGNTVADGCLKSKNFNAYTAKGSIVVDFIEDERAADELAFADEGQNANLSEEENKAS